MEQLDLFSGKAWDQKIPQTPEPEMVKKQMQDVLAQLHEADTMPWAPPLLRSWKIVFPNMARWLDPEEGAMLVADFEKELARLESN